MTALLQLILFALTAGLLYPLVKNYAPQLAPALAIAVTVGVVLLLIDAGTEVFQWIAQLGQKWDGEAFLCLAKAAGILLCSEWCCDLCKDNGLSAVGNSIDLAGRCLALAAAFPLFQSVYGAIMGLAG